MSRLGILIVVSLLASGCAGTYGSHAGPAGTAAGSATSGSAAPTPATATNPSPNAAGKVHRLASGLVYEDLVVGNGKMADPGLTVSVHYTGWLTDGTKFDSSVDRGEPLQFVLGSGRVIQGWEEGIKGMRVGGKRKLRIPSDLGYGARGFGDVIPPNAALVFDVELLGVR